MSKEIYDGLQLGVNQICSAHGMLVNAASLCEEALLTFNAATQGSAQPEVNSARQSFLEVTSKIQATGSLLTRAAVTFSGYSTRLHPQAEPVALTSAVQSQIDQGSPLARTEGYDGDFLQPSTLLVPDEYQQFPTTIQSSEQGDTMRMEIPGGYINLSVHHTTHGTEVDVDFVEVEEGQQQGKGTHLIATAARESSLRGYENLAGFYISPYSLKALANVVGAENIIIKSPANSREYFQTNDYAVALEALNQQEADETIDYYKGVRTRVDLRNASVLSKLFGRRRG